MTINYNNVLLARVGDPLQEYETTSGFPNTGSLNVLYRATDSGRIYQWTGSTYSEIGPDNITTGTHASQHSTNSTDPIPAIVGRPATLSGNVNNYSHNNSDILILDANASYSITGLAASTDGNVKIILNKSLYTIVINHQSTNSNPENRFIVPTNANHNLLSGYSIRVLYDSDSLRWRVLL